MNAFVRGIVLSSPLLLGGCVSSAGTAPRPDELDWLRAHAMPISTPEAGHGFDDLRPLKDVIGDARIVALGECTHGTREVFQMKHRLVEYLASELKFTIFSIEANMPEAYRLNDYVLEGKGDPKELIAGMYFWTWNTEEVLAMVEWMRAFNRSGKGRIEFTGFDMQTPDVAMDVVLDFLKRADTERVKAVEAVYTPLRHGQFRKEGGGGAFGRAVGTFPVEAAKGKKIRLSGWIKTEGVGKGYAGLWWRADGPDGVLAFDNMQSSEIDGTRDWRKYTIELLVPPETVNINFGALLVGSGRAWFDDIEVEIDGKPFDPAGRFDFRFEGDSPEGFKTGGDRYKVTLDDRSPHSGTKSLLMESAAKTGATVDAQVAAKACGDVLAQMEAARDKYAAATSKREADWAIQNARVVSQCLRLETSATPRDESMAENVAWILSHAPPGTRIVLWAHNGHVGRGSMGKYKAMGTFLNERYGKEQVVVGFAAGEGLYTAIVEKKGLQSDNHLSPPVTGSYESWFRASGLPAFVLDLRTARAGGSAAEWLTRTQSFRSIGAVAMTGQFAPVKLTDLYDAVIYLDKTSASRTLRRFGTVR